MKIDFIKCHGSGNDFVLIDEISNGYDFSEDERIEIAKTLCDRKGIIGADGILFILKSSVCDARMRIFNSDGSEPEMCGNGLRCVGRYVSDLINKNEASIETMKAQYKVLKTEDLYSGVKTMRIFIKSISFDLESLPMSYNDQKELFFESVEPLSDSLKFSAVSITNPHIVSFMDDININQLVEVGKRCNSTNDILPKGVNVNFVKVFEKNRIYVKTYERGVGLTKACGTGMTASSVIYARKNNINNEEISIYNDGGMIKCVAKKDNEKYMVEMIGNATFVYKGTLTFDFQNPDKSQLLSETTFEEETKSYEEFFHYTRVIIDDKIKI